MFNFVLTISYSIYNKLILLRRTFQELGHNKIKVQPFKGAARSKEHRL